MALTVKHQHLLSARGVRHLHTPTVCVCVAAPVTTYTCHMFISGWVLIRNTVSLQVDLLLDNSRNNAKRSPNYVFSLNCSVWNFRCVFCLLIKRLKDREACFCKHAADGPVMVPHLHELSSNHKGSTDRLSYVHLTQVA